MCGELLRWGKDFQLITSHAQLRFLGLLIEVDMSEARGKYNPE